MSKGFDAGFSLSRRRLMKAMGVMAVTAPFLNPRDLLAAGKITVADPGGPYQVGYGAAFYEPFRKTGNEINIVARDAEPTSQVKAMVEAKSYVWDVVSLTLSSRKVLSNQGLLEPLGFSGGDWEKLIPLAKQSDWMGVNVYGSIIACRTDTVKAVPQNWKDFYDVKNFPGRRSLPKSPIQTLEGALLADGVDPQKLYPLDVDRAFKKLDEIKPHIDVWWASFAQTTQLLQSGEVDMIATSNARAQTAIDNGVPAVLVWDGALYGLEGWGIPKGSPNAETAKEFIKLCANGKNQAGYTDALAYGPTNQEAFEFIGADRAKQLPTEPHNFAKMVPYDDDWWGANKDKMFDRFNTWLLA